MINTDSLKHVQGEGSVSPSISTASMDFEDSNSSYAPSLVESRSSYSSHSSLSSLVSPPSTPRSISRASRRYEDTSQESLTSDDKYTQIPMMSPRERRSSSAAPSLVKRRKSLASLSSNSALIINSWDLPTPSKHTSTKSIPAEGRRLIRKNIEASRKSAKEALEEDLRALYLVGQGESVPAVGDDFACEDSMPETMI